MATKLKNKTALTKFILNELNISSTQKNITKHMKLWFVDPRDQGWRSLRLSKIGLETVKDTILKSYEILFPETTSLTNEIILNLEKYLDGPYWLNNEKIVVFQEKTAIELILMQGNIYQFTKLKFKNNNLILA